LNVDKSARDRVSLCRNVKEMNNVGRGVPKRKSFKDVAQVVDPHVGNVDMGNVDMGNVDMVMMVTLMVDAVEVKKMVKVVKVKVKVAKMKVMMTRVLKTSKSAKSSIPLAPRAHLFSTQRPS
jgi:hypothetical protein